MPDPMLDDPKPKPAPMFNPMGAALILQILVFVATMLKELGVIGQLEERAKETDNPVDNVLVGILKSLLTALTG